MPKLLISDTPIQHVEGGMIVLPLTNVLDVGKYFAPSVTREITALMNNVQFKGQWGRAEMFVAPRDVPASSIAVIGMGGSGLSVFRQQEGIRRGIASAVMGARVQGIRNICIEIPSLLFLNAAIEGVLLTEYWFTEHSAAMRQQEAARSLLTATFHIRNTQEKAEAKKIMRRTQEVLRAITLTRTLVNQPASHMSPKILVEQAKSIAKASSAISLTVMNRKQVEKKKMFGFLAVARGSKEEPYVIHLKYSPKKKAKKNIVLIGKGITFDSGGLSLKPAQFMENMKIDMAGAASVLGVFSLLPSLSLDVEVHGIILACENMPSGDAYRPGDVIATMSGKTIEVLNTDAEGRITLADAITYAKTFNPDAIVDLATLTGAVVTALGDTHAALFGNTKELNDSLMRAAEEAGEGLVQFPLPNEYLPMVQSRVADLCNMSMMKSGGAITAALFLQEFVGKTPWAHLDIAGPVYAEHSLVPYWQFGATGYGVRTLVNFLETV